MSFVHPSTTGKHEPSSVFASGLKLNADGSVQPKISAFGSGQSPSSQLNSSQLK